MSLSSSAALKPGSNPSRNVASHGEAYEPYYGDMLDTIQHRSVDEAINLFSRRGYDVNVEVEYVFDDGKKYNVTPLHWAVRHRQPRLCKYLLEHGARPFSSLIFEYYPLHEACSRGYDDVLKVFIDCKVDLNRVTPDLDTPLHIAAMRGHIKCVHLLLDARADYSLRNKGGKTPVETLHGRNCICDLLYLRLQDNGLKTEAKTMSPRDEALQLSPTSPLDSTPQSHQLLRLVGRNGEEIKIRDRLSPNWEDLFLCLDFEPAEENHSMITAIRRNNVGKVEDACRDVLLKWLAGNGRKPVTWATFIDALIDMGESSLAYKIREVLTS